MKNLLLYNHWCARTAAVCAAVCATAVFMYGAFLLLAVSHTARLSVAESHIRAQGARASTLESEYLAANAALTPALARALGFVQPAAQSVVYAAPEALSVNH